MPNHTHFRHFARLCHSLAQFDVRSAFLEEMVEVSPREFGVKGDCQRFDDRVIKTEGNVSGVGEFSREDDRLGFF